MTCGPCMKSNDESARSRMACGWIPKEKWKDGAVFPVPGVKEIPKVCPGYTVHLPAVQDVARSWSWWNKGQLQIRCDKPSELLLDLIEVFNGSFVGAQEYEMNEMRRRSEQKRG